MMSYAIDDSLIRALPDLSMIVQEDGMVQSYIGGRTLRIADLPADGTSVPLTTFFGEETTRDIKRLIRRVLKARRTVMCVIRVNDLERDLQISPHGVGRALLVLRNVGNTSENSSDAAATALSPPQVLERDEIFRIAQQMISDGRLLDRCVGLALVRLGRLPGLEKVLGRRHGEHLLQSAATGLERLSRKPAARGVPTLRTGRYSTDTLLAMIGPVYDRDALAPWTEDIRMAFAQPVDLGGRSYELDPSLGVVVAPADGTGLEQLLTRAEIALAEAVTTGQPVQFFCADMGLSSLARLDMHDEIRWALERQQFLLHYQPRVELCSGRVVGLEALLRWRHPSRGLLAPPSFIALVEATVHAEGIGRWVLDQACQDLRVLDEHGLAHIAISVNVSRRHFSSEGLVRHIDAAAAAAGVNQGRLALELTERTLAGELPIDTVIEPLRASGVRLVIDDFGSKPISLRRIADLPLLAVKMEAAMVRDIEWSAAARKLCAAAIDFARGLGVTVVAKNVENATQRDFLTARGCHEAQGLLFGAPEPLPAAIDKLRKSPRHS